MRGLPGYGCTRTSNLPMGGQHCRPLLAEFRLSSVTHLLSEELQLHALVPVVQKPGTTEVNSVGEDFRRLRHMRLQQHDEAVYSGQASVDGQDLLRTVAGWFERYGNVATVCRVSQ